VNPLYRHSKRPYQFARSAKPKYHFRTILAILNYFYRAGRQQYNSPNRIAFDVYGLAAVEPQVVGRAHDLFTIARQNIREKQESFRKWRCVSCYSVLDETQCAGSRRRIPVSRLLKSFIATRYFRKG
jgi:hypothetical protein